MRCTDYLKVLVEQNKLITYTAWLAGLIVLDLLSLVVYL